jgi:uncharacterized protein YfaS (alpha-2-macroglobulin family)
MKHVSKSIMIVVILITLGLFAQISPVSAAVTLDLSVPNIVNPGVQFTVSVTVKNDSTTDTVTFNKVAAVYLLGDLKYKGPYEVDTTTRTLTPGNSTTFTFDFTIHYTSRCIVPLAVSLFNNKYDFNNAIGLNAIGVSVK